MKAISHPPYLKGRGEPNRPEDSACPVTSTFSRNPFYGPPARKWFDQGGYLSMKDIKYLLTVVAPQFADRALSARDIVSVKLHESLRDLLC